jgi:hypothetical protein
VNTVRPFSSEGKIIAVTLNHSRKELFVTVCKHPGTGMACLKANNGDVKIVPWDEITFVRDLKPEEY